MVDDDVDALGLQGHPRLTERAFRLRQRGDGVRRLDDPIDPRGGARRRVLFPIDWVEPKACRPHRGLGNQQVKDGDVVSVRDQAAAERGTRIEMASTEKAEES